MFQHYEVVTQASGAFDVWTCTGYITYPKFFQVVLKFLFILKHSLTNLNID